MNLRSARRVPDDAETREARETGRLRVRVAEAQLRDPATRDLVDWGGLVAVALDQRQPVRTRRRAAEILAVAHVALAGLLPD